MLKPVQLPFRGVSTARAFIDTPGDLCPYALDSAGKPIMRNILPYSPSADDRHTLGQRAGFDLLFPQQCGGPGGAPWRALIPVAVSSVIDGYTIGDCFGVTEGDSVDSGAITANYLQFDSVPSVDGIGALGTGNVNATAVCPERKGTAAEPYYLCFVSSNTDSGGFTIATIRCFREDTGATVWSATISEASVNRFINTMTASDNFLFVCTNAEVKVYRVLDGSLVATETLNGWAQETVEGWVWKDTAGDEWYFVGFNGTADPGTGTTVDEDSNPVYDISAGDAASQFRTGVQRFSINNEHLNPTGPYADERVLIPEVLGWGQTIDAATGLTNDIGTGYFEAFHGYFRVSAMSERVPGHGCLITCLRGDPRNGSVYVGRTNQGYGPNATGSDLDGNTFAPDGLTYPPTTVFGISFDGELLWESDVGSLTSTEVGMGGYANDIPTSATDDPTISVIAVSHLGMIGVGGRETEAEFSFFGLDPDNGSLQWQIKLQDTGLSLRQGAIAVDSGDGAFVVGGDVDDLFSGNMEDAHLWKVAALDGEIVWSFLIDPDSSVLSVSTMPDGSFIAGCDYVS